MLCGWFAVAASRRNRGSLLCSENIFFSLLIRYQALNAMLCLCWQHKAAYKISLACCTAEHASVAMCTAKLPSLQPAGLVVPWQDQWSCRCHEQLPSGSLHADELLHATNPESSYIQMIMCCQLYLPVSLCCAFPCCFIYCAKCIHPSE